MSLTALLLLTTVYQHDFNELPLGTYTMSQWAQDWNASWENGVDEGRCEIVPELGSLDGRALRVHYPEGSVGSSTGGAQWKHILPESYDELYVRYRLRFSPGFDFVKGGKLPGPAGGTANTGANPPNGTDGWSVRGMWRTGGAAVQYVYHMDQSGSYGEDFPWSVVFTPGPWHTVEHRVVMNTPGEADGIIEGWLDGILVQTRYDVRFRTTTELGADVFYFSTFFGGSGSSWATPIAVYIDFDDFEIEGD